MTRLDDELLGYLSSRYAGATSLRALFAWAGDGAATRLGDGTGNPADWAARWTSASQGARVAVVREALFDAPGDPLLVDHLGEVAVKDHPDALFSIDLLLALLERLAPFGFPLDSLEATLRAFRLPSWEAAFAALVPVVDGWLTGEARDALVSRCEALVWRPALRVDLRARRAALEATDDLDLARAAIDAVRAALSAAPPLAETDPLMIALQHVATLTSVTRASAVVALSAALELAGPIDEQDAPLLAATTGLTAALRGTRAAELADDDDDDDDVDV